MDQLSNIYFLIAFFAGLLGFVVAVILVFVNKTDTFPSRLLAGCLVCFALLAMNFALMTTKFFFSFPHFFRAFAWASFLYAPLGYLYVRSVLDQSYRLKKTDILWFLPAMIHTVGQFPFYLQPASEKLEYLNQVIEDPKMITMEPESMFPEGWPLMARIGIGVVAVIGQFILLARWKAKHQEGLGTLQQNIGIYRWLFLFTSVLAIYYSIIIIEFIFQLTSASDMNKTIIFTISGTILFVSLYLMMKPSILYGIKGWQKAEETPSVQPGNETEIPVTEVKRYSLTVEQGIAFKEAIETHFDLNHPFRKAGYTIGDLSKEVDIPAYQISTFINQEYAMNFNELVNSYRVDYLVERFRTSDHFSQFTLEALGKEAGFNSRAAFISAVKKRTGKPPSEIFGRRSEKSLT